MSVHSTLLENYERDFWSRRLRLSVMGAYFLAFYMRILLCTLGSGYVILRGVWARSMHRKY